MITNEQFWNSITMRSDEFKKKYCSDVKFWEESGKKMCDNIIVMRQQMNKPKNKKCLSKIEISDNLKKFKEL